MSWVSISRHLISASGHTPKETRVLARGMITKQVQQLENETVVVVIVVDFVVVVVVVVVVDAAR